MGLRNSLGGNCKTTLICCCSPHVYNRDETISSLLFAQRAKTIQNRATVNEKLSNEELQARIRKLEALLETLRRQGGGGYSGLKVVPVHLDSERVNTLEAQLAEANKTIELKNAEIEEAQKLAVELETHVDELRTQKRKLTRELNKLLMAEAEPPAPP